MLKKRVLLLITTLWSCSIVESDKIDSSNSLDLKVRQISKVDTIIEPSFEYLEEILLKFESEPNGVAYVELLFFNNRLFTLNMSILPEEHEDNNSIEYLNFNGKYEVKNDSFFLEFHGEKPIIDVLFDQEDVFVIKNDSTVQFNKEMKRIMIWKVPLVRVGS